MSNYMTYALMVLQQCAYAHVLCEFHRSRIDAHRQHASSGELAKSIFRLDACTRRWALVQKALDSEHLSALRVARALWLQQMLDSAPARLGAWSDVSAMHRMPPAQLLEWVAHDLERVELARLEDAMSPEEAALYASALDAAPVHYL